MKTILECIERTLSAILSASSCMGMFLVGCFIGNLICDTALSTGTMWAIFLGSVIITYILTQLLIEVRYRRLEILADELKAQKNGQDDELYNHLMESVYGGKQNEKM